MLCEIAENYFKSLNPLAERISDDIKNIKEAYENLWQGFSLSEKEQIINETIIHPEALLRYSITIQDIYGKSGCNFETGKKIVVDEHTGVSWSDEHSAPFSWKSKSLLELCNTGHCVSDLPSGQTNPKRSTVPAGAEKTDSEVLSADTVDNGLQYAFSGRPFSQFCAKFKSLPGKSYQVAQSFDEKGILSKIKNNAVCKLQNTIKMMGGKMNGNCSEGDILVVGGGAVIVPRVDKISSVISKPTSPPPPPPPRVLLRRDQAETPLLEAATPILTPKFNDFVNEPLKKDLSFDSTENNFQTKPESNMSDSVYVPKSGFDFLDDW